MYKRIYGKISRSSGTIDVLGQAVYSTAGELKKVCGGSYTHQGDPQGEKVMISLAPPPPKEFH